MRLSLKKELAIIFILLLAGTIITCWIVNVCFLEEFYLNGKEEKLIEAYGELKHQFDKGMVGTEECDKTMQHICNVNNMEFIISDAESNAIYTTTNDPEPMLKTLRDMIFGRDAYEIKLLDETEEYSVISITDRFTASDYIVIWGSMDEGNFFMIRTPVEGVRESVRVSNLFLLYVGIAAIFIGGIVIWFASKKITDPIMELSKISAKVSELNFENKYSGGGAVEIAELGSNINAMSEKLESTISDIKVANLELMKDVEARDAADARRSEFIANISHELKTPIALIQGYAEGLKEGISDDKESRDYYCSVIMDETSKMNQLVKRLILLNQVESGADTMVMERFDINEMLKACIASFDVMTEESGIRVTYEEKPDTYVWGDELQTEEVFRNYFSNAVHYCSGSREIRVTITNVDDAVRVAVFNTGEPIPEENLEKLWEKFYKADQSRSREYGGSGLGLSIVKAIMESMNGKYGVNDYNDGVEFWFELQTK